jgi:hypothetical protein
VEEVCTLITTRVPALAVPALVRSMFWLTWGGRPLRDDIMLSEYGARLATNCCGT